MTRNTRLKLVLLASILTGLAGAAHQLPERWSAALTVAGIVGAAIAGTLHTAPEPRRRRR